jgi:hypothetical protein
MGHEQRFPPLRLNVRCRFPKAVRRCQGLTQFSRHPPPGPGFPSRAGAPGACETALPLRVAVGEGGIPNFRDPSHLARIFPE